MNRQLLVAVLLVGAGATFFGGRLIGRPTRRASDNPAASERPDVSPDLTAEVAELRRRLARIEQGEASRGQTLGSSLRTDAEEEARRIARKQADEKLRKYYSPELESKIFTGYFNTLDGIRRGEGVDVSWAREIDTFVHRGVQNDANLASLNVQSVDCGRSLCRVELRSSNEAQKKMALGAFIMKMGPQLPQASIHVPLGSNQVTAYFARPGAELPPMDSPDQLIADLP